MFLDKTLDEIAKKNKVVVGFDLENDFSQISYCYADQSVPETISLVNGEEQYSIPTVLCRRKQTDQWAAGKEAIRLAKEGEGILIEDLVLLARNQTQVTVGEEEYEAAGLLEIFIRKALSLLSSFAKLEDVAAIVFTLKDITQPMMELLREIINALMLSKPEVYFMSHKDCFFQYMIHQPEEMWIHDVVLFEYRTDGIMSCLLEMNQKTLPVVGFISEEKHPQMKMTEVSQMEKEQKEAYYKQLDAAFGEIAKASCENRTVASVFLLGDAFSTEWCKESLRYLCHNRRVFQGNNLYSKGACYGAREKVLRSALSDKYVYLSEEKLKANLGLNCNRGQEEVYIPLLDAGTNWYEAYKELDMILAKDNRIPVIITPLDGKPIKIAEITLEGLSVRGNKTNRVKFQIDMKNAATIRMVIEDKGFGEFFSSSGQVWKEEFEIV